MEYSEEDIQKIKKVIQLHLDKYGVERTANLLKNIGNDEFWKELKKAKDHSPNLYDSDTFLTLDDLDQGIENVSISSDEAKTIWEIFSKNPEIQQIFSKSLNEMEYKIDDIDLRLTNIYTLISTLEFLDEIKPSDYDNFYIIYEAVNNKINQLSFVDFCTIYSNSIADNFLNNPKYRRAIEKKIKNMTASEFIYFISTAQDYIDINDKDIVEMLKSKNESLDDAFVNMVYESLHYIDLPQANITTDKLDNVTRLIRGIEDPQEAVDTFKNLTDTQLIEYFIFYDGKTELLNKNVFNSEEFNKRIKNLSRENIIFLVEKFIDIYDYAKKMDKPVEGDLTKEYGMQWEIIIQEALNRGLIKENFEVTYSEEDMFNVINMENIYEINKNIGILPVYYPTLFEKQFEDEEDEIEEDEEFEKDDVLDYLDEIDEDDDYAEEYKKEQAQKYKDLVNKINESIVFYDEMNKLYHTPDIKILQIANHFNTKYKDEDIEHLTEYQQYVIRFLKSRIINMPLKFANFFMMVDNGCLNGAMKLNVNELKHEFLNIEDEDLNK